MNLLLIILASIFSSVVAAAEEIGFVRTEMSVVRDDKELSKELTTLLLAKTTFPMRVEYYPPPRVVGAIAQTERTVCGILAKSTIDEVDVAAIRPVSRFSIVIAEFNPVRANERPTIGGLNSFVYRQAALNNGVDLHQVPSLASAAGMIRAGRLTHFLAADGVIKSLVQINNLTVLDRRVLSMNELWIACSPKTSPEDRASIATLWGRLLISGDIERIFKEFNAEEGLAKPEASDAPQD